MKKILCCMAIFGIVFASCSPGENSTPSNPQVKSFTYTTYSDDGPFPQTVNFHYQNGIVTGFDNLNYDLEFSYENGNLVLAESFLENGQVDEHIEFLYNGTALDSIVESRSGFPDSKVDLTYDGAHIMQTTGYRYQNSTYQHVDSKEYVWTGDNLMQEDSYLYFPNSIEFRKEYAYDTKNNPFKNMNPVFKLMFSNGWGFSPLGENNPLSESYHLPIGSTITSPQYSYTYNITYNAGDYPIEIKQYRVSDNVLISSTTFEYQ